MSYKLAGCFEGGGVVEVAGRRGGTRQGRGGEGGGDQLMEWLASLLNFSGMFGKFSLGVSAANTNGARVEKGF